MTVFYQPTNTNTSRIAPAACLFLLVCSMLIATKTSEAVVPTCESLGNAWSFPNSCAYSCEDMESTMDVDRSRNVNGLLKCFCENQEQPFCTDDPLCEYLGIFPGTVAEDCARECGDGVEATSNTGVDDNGYQFHYLVSCSCAGTPKCGEDFVLLSDLDYMKSCTGGKDDANSLEIATADDCDAHCTDTNVFVDGGQFASAGQNKTCSCLHPSIQSNFEAGVKATAVLVCDDATARANDGGGLGNPCYENVGVNKVECPTPSSSASANTQPTAATATKTLVSSTAIMGVWLLPW